MEDLIDGEFKIITWEIWNKDRSILGQQKSGYHLSEKSIYTKIK